MTLDPSTCEKFDTDMLLRLWEHGLRQPEWARGDALVEAGFVGSARPRTLGERNARLIELHARLFGRNVELLSHCPGCGTVSQFSGDCAALATDMRPKVDAASPHRLEACGHRVEFRLPDSGDVASASGDDENFVQLLLDRCVLASTFEGHRVPVGQLPAAVLDALSQEMETLDPGASASFALECPHCATCWHAPLDVGGMLWQKVRRAAERLLLDIHVLAQAYGWTEAEVLRLNPVRRAAYLQMVTA